ncbi:hypothetical protein [Paludisphaera soli]|uniref:hypothetical protein n=1 Tax=Paludisphaera soli TaxID=2712865 RepID=UPI0013EA7DEC|nr:hypothetical protein [Paludisphaera soli]
MNDEPARPEAEDAEPSGATAAPGEPIGDEAAEMARIADSLSALIGRMAEFQKEMEPFLTLLAEPESGDEPTGGERPVDRPE